MAVGSRSFEASDLWSYWSLIHRAKGSIDTPGVPFRSTGFTSAFSTQEIAVDLHAPQRDRRRCCWKYISVEKNPSIDCE